MSRRLAAPLALAVLLTLLVAGVGQTQEQPLVAAELHQKASQRGTVRVLVELQASFVPETHLPTAAHALAQRQNISAIQGLVQRSLRGVAHRIVRDFRGAVPVYGHPGRAGWPAPARVTSGHRRSCHRGSAAPTGAVGERPAHFRADQAVALGYDGSGAVIVVMDTGIEKAHPFFEDGTGASRVVAEACFSSNEPSESASQLVPRGPVDAGRHLDRRSGLGRGLLAPDRRLQSRHAGRRDRRRPACQPQRGGAGRRAHRGSGLLTVQRPGVLRRRRPHALRRELPFGPARRALCTCATRC